MARRKTTKKPETANTGIEKIKEGELNIVKNDDTDFVIGFRGRDADFVNFPKTVENLDYIASYDDDELFIYISDTGKVITKRDYDKS